ncbi:hypothetical protein [Nitratifractor salsuginis]|uniref:hypothetical protein n=1 Tax=Nitratifractor salsuginis TaxID=269261 RepID=UPI0011D159DD|nr:hypothetical protein [Nitratifractor salsuginis]
MLRYDSDVSMVRHPGPAEKMCRRKQPYIFVDTDFKRRNQPIFALAMLEFRRRLRIGRRRSTASRSRRSWKWSAVSCAVTT